MSRSQLTPQGRRIFIVRHGERVKQKFSIDLVNQLIQTLHLSFDIKIDMTFGMSAWIPSSFDESGIKSK